MTTGNVSNQERMRLMQETIDNQGKVIEELKAYLEINGKIQKSNVNEYDDIRLDKMIPVISLIPYELSMIQMSPSGKPKYKFENFGDKKPIIYQDVITLIEQYRHFIERGYFYIDDHKVVERHGLSEIYSNILSKVKIEEVLECRTMNSVTLYTYANVGQRNMINEFIIGKIRDSNQEPKELFNINFVRDISDIGGKDLIKIGLEARENRKMMEKPVEMKE